MKRNILGHTLAGVCLLAGVAWGQDSQGDRVTVPFRDPSKPRLLRIGLLQGNITVRGYDGKDAVVEAVSRDGSRRRSRTTSSVPTGMRRLDAGGTGLTVEEQDNVLRVGTGSMHSEVDITVQVPRETSLKLSCTNCDRITVEGVSGEIDVNATNGGVKLSNVSGAVVAHALNEDVVVTFDRVLPDKAMSFSSLNGNVDVTLPATLKARVKLKADNGEIYSDFDVKMDPSSTRAQVEDAREKGGKYRVRFDRAMYGTINGGGPEMQFTTFNGKIFLRKK